MIARNILDLASVFSAYLFLMALLPFWLRGYRLAGENTLDKLVETFLLSHVAVILSVYALSLSGLYGRAAITALILLLYLSPRLLFHRGGIVRRFRGLLLWIQRASEGSVNVSAELKRLGAAVGVFAKAMASKVGSWPGFAATAAIFGYRLYYSSYHAVANMFYGYSDIYLHTEWIKFLQINRPFQGGVYPMGMHNVAVAVSDVFGIHIVTVLRMFGPIVGMGILFSLYYFLRRAMTSLFAVNASLALYAVANLFSSSVMNRHSFAIPQEYATMFLYLAVFYLYRYLRETRKGGAAVERGSPRALFCFSATVCLTLLVHFFITAFAFLACGAVFLTHRSHLGKESFRRLLLGLLCAAAVAAAPLGAGLLKGAGLNNSFAWAVSIMKDEPTEGQPEAVGEEPAAPVRNPVEMIERLVGSGFFTRGNILDTRWFIPYLAAGLFGLASWWFRGKTGRRGSLYAAMSGYSLALFLLTALGLSDVLHTIEVTRLLSYFCYSVPIVFCVALELLHIRIQSKRGRLALTAAASACGCLYFALNGGLIPLDTVMMLQHSGAMTAYYKVMENFPRNKWIIVSSYVEYPLCLNDGWHYEMAQFVADIGGAEESPFYLEADNLFFFVVKRPNLYQHVVRIDDIAVIPEYPGESLYGDVLGMDPTRNWLPAYDDLASNSAIQAKANAWAREYMRYYPKEMTVFFEDDDLIVYRLRQNPNELSNILIPYEGNSHLFEEGNDEFSDA